MKEKANKNKKEKFIFDSNVFDDIVDGKLKIDSIKNVNLEIYLTHVQNDEVQSCLSEKKRKALTSVMLKLRSKIIPTESAVYGVSRLGKAKLGGGIIYKKIKGKGLNHVKDALIGEVAIKNGLILVTNDKRLIFKVSELGGIALSVSDFKKVIFSKNV